jgi:cytochrome c oxidase subunit 2
VIRPLVLLACCAFGAALFGCAGPKDPMTRGQMRYQQCAPCHGEQGRGNAALEAPPIAGLPQWYVEAQLTKFRIGARGAHFDDAAGLRMRPMALTMPAEEDVVAVAQYVATLPQPPKAPATITTANVQHGQQSFTVCVACHGIDGSGNQQLNAPPIAGHPDWYVQSQLRKFKAGIRGAHPKDTSGATMRAIAVTLADEQAMQDLAAYVASLPKKSGT